ncbi:Outer dense fiber protein 3-like protein 2 [Tritrichomonas musculus]|uniref:Outer dense fiber protein 3-like protein 2 n=1 Tax=Tritrichomonas musculus TaxID=1915356 RepID=A0ABR2L1D3_9EUKA
MGKETWARKLGKEVKPGPADYTTRTEPGTDSPRYTIKNLYPDPKPKLDVPYNDIPSTVGDTLKFTIRPHTDLPEGNDNPGPTYIPHPLGYDYLKRKNGTMRKRDFTIDRREPKYKSYSQSPFGPAKYDARENPGWHKDPSYTIGEHCGQSWIRTNSNPSSAAYRPDLTLTMPSSPKYSIHDRVLDPQPPETPGPGEYDVPDGLNRRPLSVHPLHKDFEPYKTPGPGKYDIPDAMGNGSPKISIRTLCPQKPDTHGVKYLKIKREFDEPSARMSIHERHKDIEGFQTPGPGEYQIPSSWNSKKGARMSPRGAKGELWGAIYDKWRSPGPAEYSPDHRPTQPSEPAYSLGDTLPSGWQGPMIKAGVPGPGQYNDGDLTNPGRYRRSPRFTIRPKCGPTEPESPTKDAGYVRLTKMPYEKPAMSIHPREELELIPK